MTTSLSHRLRSVGIHRQVRTLFLVAGTEIEGLEVETSRVQSLSMSLRDEWRKIGSYPIILGDEHSLGCIRSSIPVDSDPQSIIQAATETKETPGMGSSSALDDVEVLGIADLPTIPRRSVLPLDPIAQLAEYSFIGFFPVNEAWEVFAWIDYGGWNDCPDTHTHCVLHRQWHKRFRAEPVLVLADTVMTKAFSRTRNFIELKELLSQHLSYCRDGILQGESLAHYAARLIRGDPWVFWWD